MEYYLMHKDDPVTLCEFTDDGTMVAFSPRFKNPELAPVDFRAYHDHIRRWWINRQIPLRQGRVEEILKAKGLIGPGEYLLNNLGLSLTDHYWIKPINTSLKWADVNLFENNFRDDLLSFPKNSASPDQTPPSMSPNSSLRGELEKTWTIIGGKRLLVKGNHGSSSSESINEVIATLLHHRHGFDNYARYKLIHIKDKPYDYGCCSEAFTDVRTELVSAYALLTSESPQGTTSEYERLIALAVKGGLDEAQLRTDLEYQIVTDFLLSNVDRHMDNIGFLRDSDTLKLIRMAPIFDTGRAFGGSGIIPVTDDEIHNIEINSFERSEAAMLSHVRNRDVFDSSKALSSEQIESLYRKDSKASPYTIKSVSALYRKKLELLNKWQNK